jgi:hypothetical protein
MTFNQFQAKIKDAKKRVEERGRALGEIAASMPDISLSEIEQLVTVDTDELKKLEKDLGEELKADFSTTVEPESVEEEKEGGDNPTDEVEKKD